MLTYDLVDWTDPHLSARPEAYELRWNDLDKVTGARTGLSVFALEALPTKGFLRRRGILRPIGGIDDLEQGAIEHLGLRLHVDPKDRTEVHWFIEGLPDPFAAHVSSARQRRELSQLARLAALKLLRCATPVWRGDALDSYP